MLRPFLFPEITLTVIFDNYFLTFLIGKTTLSILLKIKTKTRRI